MSSKGCSKGAGQPGPAEAARLEAARGGAAWRKWGPYLSERQWGTVREDYSVDGNAWDYFTHDQARSRAYHWGEDGLAGISDDAQQLCFALALWNGHDPILKERLFGLTNAEGNHGEDVKEYYFYLDSTPTHSYMKWLYKYPQRAYPVRRTGRDQPEAIAPRARVRADRYRRLRRQPLLRRPGRVREGVARGRPDPDHGDQPRRRAGDAARAADALVPQHLARRRRADAKPSLRRGSRPERYPGDRRHARARSVSAGCTSTATLPLLFTENETNTERLFGTAERAPQPSRTASTTSSSTAAPTRSRPSTSARRRPRTARRVIAGGQTVVWRLQAVGPGADAGRGIPSPTSTRCSPRAFAKRTSSIGRSSRRRRSADAGERDAPGARRHVVEQAVLLPGREPLARRARRRAVRRRRTRRHAEQRLGRTWSTPT